MIGVFFNTKTGDARTDTNLETRPNEELVDSFDDPTRAHKLLKEIREEQEKRRSEPDGRAYVYMNGFF